MDENKEVREQLTQAYKNGDFVFVPFRNLPKKNGLFIPVVTEIKPKITDFYEAQGKFGQHHLAMMVLADAAGVRWASECGTVGRVDNRNNPNYCSFRVVAQIRTYEGLWTDIAAHKHLDLDAKREAIEIKHAESFDYKAKFGGGKGPNGYSVKKPWPATKDEYIKKFTSRDINQLRDNIDERCESGAQVRAIKNILHLPGAWPAGQNKKEPECLRKSFYIVKYILDPQNPQVQAAQLGAFTQAISGIYGHPVPQPPRIQAPEPKEMEILTPEVVEEPDSKLVDFQNLSFGEKIKTIMDLVKSYGYKKFDADTEGKGLKGWSDDALVKYFVYLMGESKK